MYTRADIDAFGTLVKDLSWSAEKLDTLLSRFWSFDGLIALAIINNCSTDVFQYLIDKGCSIHAKWLKKEPLYYAIKLGRQDLWERLLTAGADYTGIFHRCCGRLHKPEIVQSLLSKYPDLVDTKDCYGNSALEMAACYGNIETARLLVSYGADTMVLNEFGRTALEYIHHQIIQEGYDDRTTTRVRMGMEQIIRLLSEEQRAYLVYKGFEIYGREHEIFKQRLPEIKFNNHDTEHHVVKEVLVCVWSRSNYDVFGELMRYLTELK